MTPSRLAGLTRFGQVNFTEADVRLADVDYWTDVWRRTRVEAVLLNCGGIMAYHPTKLAGHPIAVGVAERDLFGEMVAAARKLGIEVVGRLDVGVVDRRFRDLHPDWMMTGVDGSSLTLNAVTGGAWGAADGPRIENEMYYSCINTGLFTEYLPALLSEVAGAYDVAGFFTNGFPTVALASPSVRMRCWCADCLALWRDRTGFDELPVADDPDDPRFPAFVEFLRSTSLERLRDLERHTRALGPGLSFNTSAIPALGGGLPWDEWVDELDVVFCDNQDRSPDYGRAAPPHALWEVGWSSELLRSVSQGKQAMRVQSTARMRHGGRHSSKNPAELGLQMALALEHGELPMWHAVSVRQHSRRWVDTVVEFDSWLADVGLPLLGRAPVADVGVVWSQESTWLADWGRAAPGPAFGHALTGWYYALLRARIPAQFVRADGREGFAGLRTLVLPSGLVLSASAIERITEFVTAGGALVVNGTAGAIDEWGRPHAGDPIARLVGVERDAAATEGPVVSAYLGVEATPFWATSPEERDEEVVAAGNWHTPFTGAVSSALPRIPSEFVIPTHAAALPEATAPATVAWNEDAGRTVYLAADLDARFFRHRIPEHRELLAGVAAWALAGPPTVTVTGTGIVDVRSWRSGDELLVIITNLDNPGLNDEPVDELRPVGPLTVRIEGFDVSGDAQLARAGSVVAVRSSGTASLIGVARVTDVEVVRVTVRERP